MSDVCVQIWVICGRGTWRTCLEESCRGSPVPSSASRGPTCEQTLMPFCLLLFSRLLLLHSELSPFLFCCSFMFDEPSSYLDVKQRLKAAITIRSLITPDRWGKNLETTSCLKRHLVKCCSSAPSLVERHNCLLHCCRYCYFISWLFKEL